MAASRRSSDSGDEWKGLLPRELRDIDEENVPARRRRTIVLWLSLCLNVVLMVAVSTWLLTVAPWNRPSAPKRIFSPANDAIEYETVVFHTGIQNDRTPYTGSGDEVEEAWTDLYNDFGLSLIDREDAAKLPNQTAPASFDTSKYLVELDVFHQLHCLNRLRKLLYPDKYPIDLSEAGWLMHGEHCVEGLRQALQCQSDVATIFWEWSEKDGRMKGNTATTHTCRKFSRIQEWAKEHFVNHDDDFSVHTAGAPVRHIAGSLDGV